jgi:hypothetical protein
MENTWSLNSGSDSVLDDAACRAAGLARAGDIFVGSGGPGDRAA